jgi:hypothetical protein
VFFVLVFFSLSSFFCSFACFSFFLSFSFFLQCSIYCCCILVSRLVVAGVVVAGLVVGVLVATFATLLAVLMSGGAYMTYEPPDDNLGVSINPLYKGLCQASDVNLGTYG